MNPKSNASKERAELLAFHRLVVKQAARAQTPEDGSKERPSASVSAKGFTLEKLSPKLGPMFQEDA